MSRDRNRTPKTRVRDRSQLVQKGPQEDVRGQAAELRIGFSNDILQPAGVITRLVNMPPLGGNHDPSKSPGGFLAEPLGLYRVEAKGRHISVRLAQPKGKPRNGTRRSAGPQFIR